MTWVRKAGTSRRALPSYRVRCSTRSRAHCRKSAQVMERRPRATRATRWATRRVQVRCVFHAQLRVAHASAVSQNEPRPSPSSRAATTSRMRRWRLLPPRPAQSLRTSVVPLPRRSPLPSPLKLRSRLLRLHCPLQNVLRRPRRRLRRLAVSDRLPMLLRQSTRRPHRLLPSLRVCPPVSCCWPSALLG